MNNTRPELLWTKSKHTTKDSNCAKNYWGNARALQLLWGNSLLTWKR